MDNKSIGLVKTQYFTFERDSFLELECGEKLESVTLAYETYGKLDSSKTNAILICHALSGDANAAGYHDEKEDKPGWWDNMVGPGKGIDTNKYFVICSNVIGGCQGSTGPYSINPKTNIPYAMDFPVVTIEDMVNAQKKLIDFLGIERLHSVVGGSMGGMQALQWSISYPDNVESVIALATTARHSAQTIAFDEVGRQAILSDPNWNNGNYYGKDIPHRGLAVARMIGHITYLSEKAMHEKFGRRLQDKAQLDYDFSAEFQVESYLRYKGGAFTKRFDPNSYLYITKALDYFDLAQKYGSLIKAFEFVRSKYLFIAYSADWLYPPSQTKETVNALRANIKDVTFFEINSSYGHDAFLIEDEKSAPIISDFLRNV